MAFFCCILRACLALFAVFSLSSNLFFFLGLSLCSFSYRAQDSLTCFLRGLFFTHVYLLRSGLGERRWSLHGRPGWVGARPQRWTSVCGESNPSPELVNITCWLRAGNRHWVGYADWTFRHHLPPRFFPTCMKSTSFGEISSALRDNDCVQRAQRLIQDERRTLWPYESLGLPTHWSTQYWLLCHHFGLY